MRKDKELTNPESCLNKAKANEPIFVLRANDELAPKIVRDWATEYDKQKRAKQGGMLNGVQVGKIREARRLADDMEEWQLFGRYEQPSL